MRPLLLLAMAALSCGDNGPLPPTCEPGDASCQAQQEALCKAIAVGAACREGDQCSYGSESCCFETYPEVECWCQSGGWSCYATDACLGPAFNGYCACDSSCPDPAPGAPNVECWDGTTGGPVCEKVGVERCAWTIRECPPEPGPP